MVTKKKIPSRPSSKQTIVKKTVLKQPAKSITKQTVKPAAKQTEVKQTGAKTIIKKPEAKQAIVNKTSAKPIAKVETTVKQPSLKKPLPLKSPATIRVLTAEGWRRKIAKRIKMRSKIK
ncbi:MAG: hypothetical protein H0W88_10880 [Parachlamydiaceae bacterium]|nr:hypothetical protein [Parachlamydiaceae bacterium]